MIIDSQTVLNESTTLDLGISGMRLKKLTLHVQQFSHLEQSDDAGVGFVRVRKGRRPNLRYVRAVYKPLRVDL